MTAATAAVSTSLKYFGNLLPNLALTPQTFSHAWLTAETDEANDIAEFGYLPAGIIVFACFNASADLDTGSALRQTIMIGSTEIKTGSTVASAGGGEIIVFTPITLTAPTLVQVKTTTGATTHANGVQYLTLLYYRAA